MSSKSMMLEPLRAVSATSPVQSKPVSPAYPEGLKIHLGIEELKKLGIEELPDVGTVMTISGEVEVSKASHEKGIYGEHKDLCLQITYLEVGKPKELELGKSKE
jgi:hypothetical protein